MLQGRYRIGLLLALAACCPLGAQAQISNPSFEGPAIGAGSFGSAATSWSNADVWFPGAGFFTTPIPDGNQVGYNNGGTLSQILPNVLSVGQTSLTAAFGQRLDGLTGTSQFQLFAGSTVIATKTLVPGTDLTSGHWTDETISYTALAGDPLLGSPLKVSVTLVSGGQVDVDNFRLSSASATATPEPGTLALLAACGISGGAFLRRRTRKQPVSQA